MDQVFSKENKTLKKYWKIGKNTGKVREKSGNFVSPEKWEPWPPWRRPPQRRHPPEGAPPKRRHPPEETPQEGTPPRGDPRRRPPTAEYAGRYGQRADGTHPTGMQSCFRCISSSVSRAFSGFPIVFTYPCYVLLLWTKVLFWPRTAFDHG